MSEDWSNMFKRLEYQTEIEVAILRGKSTAITQIKTEFARYTLCNN